MGLHRPDGHSRYLRYLLVGQLLEIEEGYHRAVAGRQTLDLAVDPFPPLPSLVLDGRVLLFGMDPGQLHLRLIFADAVSGIPLQALHSVDAQVMGDGIEPCGEPGIPPKGAQGSPRAQEALLGHLRGQVVVGQRPEAQVEDVALVALHQLLEGSGIPRRGLARQLLVGQLPRRYLLGHYPAWLHNEIMAELSAG